MIRGFFRLIGLLLLAGGFIFMVYDGARFVADQTLLTSVVWNNFDEASSNEVVLEYERRPDPHRGFATGILEAITRRLKSVAVRHGGALVRRGVLPGARSSPLDRQRRRPSRGHARSSPRPRAG